MLELVSQPLLLAASIGAHPLALITGRALGDARYAKASSIGLCAIATIICLTAGLASAHSLMITLAILATYGAAGLILYRVRLTQGSYDFYSTLAGVSVFTTLTLTLSGLYQSNVWQTFSIVTSAGVGLSTHYLTKAFLKKTKERNTTV
ncbi:hypothetical protein [Marinobacter sp.]|uniref:hypothetical protein n=1 Tax=Marinobacter sp. TaxID=50741 RepID=UPI003A93456C